MEVKLYNTKAEEVGNVTISDDIFNSIISTGSIYYAVNNELANRRVGTACTKTRAEVNYSNTKPFKQKGTGNARQGDKKSPIRVGGGTIFGPRPRDYSYSIPKKMKRRAAISLLSSAAQEGRLRVVEDFTVSGKTKEASLISKAFNGKDHLLDRLVIVMKDDDKMIRRACKNIPNVRVLAYDKLSCKELLYAKKLLIMQSACTKLEDFFLSKADKAKANS